MAKNINKHVLEVDQEFVKESEKTFYKIKTLMDSGLFTSEMYDQIVLLRGLLANWFQKSPSSLSIKVELLTGFVDDLKQLLSRRDENDFHPMWHELAFVQAHALSFLMMTLLKSRDVVKENLDVKRSLSVFLEVNFFPLGDLIVKRGEPDFFERFTLGFNLLNMRFKVLALMLENFSFFLLPSDNQLAASKLLSVSRQQLDLLKACWDVEGFYQHAKKIRFSSAFHPHAFFMYVPLQVMSMVLTLGRLLPEKAMKEVLSQFPLQKSDEMLVFDILDELLEMSRSYLSDVIDCLKEGLFEDDPFSDPHFDLAIRMITDQTLVTWGLKPLLFPQEKEPHDTRAHPNLEEIVTHIINHLASSRSLHENAEFVYSGAGIEYTENLYYFMMIVGFHAIKSKNDKILKLLPELLPLHLQAGKGKQLYPDLHFADQLIRLAFDINEEMSTESLQARARGMLSLSVQSRLILERKMMALIVGLGILLVSGEKTVDEVVSEFSESAKRLAGPIGMQENVKTLSERLFDQSRRSSHFVLTNGPKCPNHAFHVEFFFLAQILAYLSERTSLNVEIFLEML